MREFYGSVLSLPEYCDQYARRFWWSHYARQSFPTSSREGSFRTNTRARGNFVRP